MTHFPLRPRLGSLALALFFCSSLAQAQYSWIGPNGTRHYSDQPPPPGTPASKILKGPGRPAPVQFETAPADGAQAPAAAQAPAEPGAKKPPTLADREADYRKRVKAREEAEQKAQQEARTAAARSERCAALAAERSLYESGARIRTADANGEQRVLTDADRAAGVARANRALADCR